METAKNLRLRLEEVRTLLVAQPNRLPLDDVRPLLQEVASGLEQMRQNVEARKASLTPEEREDMLKVLGLATRIGALYTQALHLYTPAGER
ncbi:MAG: hypothetical protein OHK0021_09310 [Bryobacter sp.]